MNGPWRILSVQGSLQIFHFLWPDPNENNYWLYFLILCNKNGMKGVWGNKGGPSLGPGPALVLQWTLPWPYNTPNKALYILAIFSHKFKNFISCTKFYFKKIFSLTRTPLRPRRVLDPTRVLTWSKLVNFFLKPQDNG